MLDNLDLNAIKDEKHPGIDQAVIEPGGKFICRLAGCSGREPAITDEVNRLKGEQGKPKIKGNSPNRQPTDHSSENERHQSRQRHKKSKKAEIQIDREQVVEVDSTVFAQGCQVQGV